MAWKIYASTDRLISIGDLVVRLPSSHVFFDSSKADKNVLRKCFLNFIEKELIPKNRQAIKTLNKLGAYFEISFSKSSGPQEFLIEVDDLEDNWCNKTERLQKLDEIKRKIDEKIDTVFGESFTRGLSSSTSNGGDSGCANLDFSLFKLNERARLIYNQKKELVTNVVLKKALFEYFYRQRSRGEIKHVISGTEFVVILGGKNCLTRKYKLDIDGEIVLDYCLRKESREKQEPDKVNINDPELLKRELDFQKNFEKLMEKIERTDFSEYSEDELGFVYDEDGEIVENETILEAFYDYEPGE